MLYNPFKNARYFLLILFLLFKQGSSLAQKTVAGLSQHLNMIQKGSPLPGFAVAIVKNDSVLFSGAYGFADKKRKIPYTPQTIQPLGSVSKTIVGLALVQAIDKGYFNLETAVNDLLPFKISNPNMPNAVIRIKHLVTHTSGLLDNEEVYTKTYAAVKRPAMELKDFLVSYYTPAGANYNLLNFGKAAPGREYHYSNIASALAAYIIEIKAKIPFSKFTADYIFAPLKMQDTHWLYDDQKSSRYATLYEVNMQYDPLYKTLLNSDGSVKPYSCITYPDGSLRSTLDDMTRYLCNMIRGYNGQPGIASKAAFQLLFKKQFSPLDMPANMDPREPNRALFWGYNRKNKIAQTGGDPGLSCLISFDPITKIGRVIMLNTQLAGKNNIVLIEAFANLQRSLDKFELGK